MINSISSVWVQNPLAQTKGVQKAPLVAAQLLGGEIAPFFENNKSGKPEISNFPPQKPNP
jgi:hypothetical protein